MKWNTGQKDERELIPADNHPAVCVGIADTGTHPNPYSEGKFRRIVRLTWEIPSLEETTGAGDAMPRLTSRNFTASLYKTASLRAFLIGWRGKDFEDEAAIEAFDNKDLLGTSCLLNVVHTTAKDGKEIAYATQATKMPSGMESPQAKTEHFYFSLDDGEFDATVFGNLPEFLQKTISESIEFQELKAVGLAPEMGAEIDDGEIPF